MKNKLSKIFCIMILMIVIFSNNAFAAQKYPTTYWGLFADFRTEDLVRINAWDMIGKSGYYYDWGIVAKGYLDMEVGNIVCILDTEDPNVKKVGFIYKKITIYIVDYNEVDWVVHLISPPASGEVWSINDNNKCFPITMQ